MEGQINRTEDRIWDWNDVIHLCEELGMDPSVLGIDTREKVFNFIKKHCRNENSIGEAMDQFTSTGAQIGELVASKNRAYGDSFKKSCICMEQMYPNGIPVEQYQHALYIVRVLDKLFRIATDKDAFGENPKKDIAGYSILGVVTDEKKEERYP